MSKVYFGIPSYNRPETQDTLDMLLRLGCSNIIISTQTEQDYIEYDKRYGKCANVVYRKGNKASDNRNTILDNIEQDAWCVMMDDDIQAINQKNGTGTRTIATKEEFEKFINDAIRIADSKCAQIVGIYPTDNAYFMKHGYSVDKILIGTMFIIKNTGMRFSSQFRVKEDYEYCCRLISKGGHTIRLNDVSVKAKHYTNKGGCHDDWGANKDCTDALLMLYPDLVKRNPRRKNEVLSVK